METTQHEIVCIHCGADEGLHQYDTQKCPYGGREETREGVAQRWLETTYRDNEVQIQLNEAAAERDALREQLRLMTIQRDGAESMLIKCEARSVKLVKALIKAQRALDMILADSSRPKVVYTATAFGLVNEALPHIYKAIREAEGK